MNWLHWKFGRQGTGYEKMLLLKNKWVVPFDIYLLRYKVGSYIPYHTDPVDGKKHYRLNIVLKKAREGGELSIIGNPMIRTNRMVLFNPDRMEHSVTKITKGSRYVLSIGWVR